MFSKVAGHFPWPPAMEEGPTGWRGLQPRPAQAPDLGAVSHLALLPGPLTEEGANRRGSWVATPPTPIPPSRSLRRLLSGAARCPLPSQVWLPLRAELPSPGARLLWRAGLARSGRQVHAREQPEVPLWTLVSGCIGVWPGVSSEKGVGVERLGRS